VVEIGDSDRFAVWATGQTIDVMSGTGRDAGSLSPGIQDARPFSSRVHLVQPHGTVVVPHGEDFSIDGQMHLNKVQGIVVVESLAFLPRGEVEDPVRKT